MIAYLTNDAVNAVLGANWASGKEQLNTTLANAWLNTQALPVFTTIPENVITAGLLIAQAYAKGEMYQTEPVLTEKMVKADTVQVTKKFASGGQVKSQLEQQALLLLAPYLIKPRTGYRQVRVERA